MDQFERPLSVEDSPANALANAPDEIGRKVDNAIAERARDGRGAHSGTIVMLAVAVVVTLAVIALVALIKSG